MVVQLTAGKGRGSLLSRKFDRKKGSDLLLVLLILAAGILIIRGPKESKFVFSTGRAFPTLIIDAGHGGEDGGAVSVSGREESEINLAIALKLDALFGFAGVPTVMLRTEDVSLHTPDSNTLRQKKVSDLHNRVSAINQVPNGLLISIHQNTYPSSSLHGAQVFYSDEESSLSIAQIAQENLRLLCDPDNTRKAARIPNSVYLMNNITCPGILVECGFLSNPKEDILLQTEGYQIKLTLALVKTYFDWLTISDPSLERRTP